MLTYTIRRLLIMIPTLLVISFVTFSIIKLPPGDFLSNQIAELRSQGDKAALERAEFMRAQFGLDKPFLEQYAVWVGIWPTERGFSGLLQGDWGWSFEHDLPVAEVVGDRMLLSFILNFTVILFTWAVAFPIGAYAATHQYSWGDYGLTLLGYVGLATPNFLTFGPARMTGPGEGGQPRKLQCRCHRCGRRHRRGTCAESPCVHLGK